MDRRDFLTLTAKMGLVLAVPSLVALKTAEAGGALSKLRLSTEVLESGWFDPVMKREVLETTVFAHQPDQLCAFSRSTFSLRQPSTDQRYHFRTAMPQPPAVKGYQFKTYGSWDNHKKMRRESFREYLKIRGLEVQFA